MGIEGAWVGLGSGAGVKVTLRTARPARLGVGEQAWAQLLLRHGG